MKHETASDKPGQTAASHQTDSQTGSKSSQESLRKEIEELEALSNPTAEQTARIATARAEYTTLVEEAAKNESAKPSHDADDKAPR